MCCVTRLVDNCFTLVSDWKLGRTALTVASMHIPRSFSREEKLCRSGAFQRKEQRQTPKGGHRPHTVVTYPFQPSPIDPLKQHPLPVCRARCQDPHKHTLQQTAESGISSYRCFVDFSPTGLAVLRMSVKGPVQKQPLAPTP